MENWPLRKLPERIAFKINTWYTTSIVSQLVVLTFVERRGGGGHAVGNVYFGVQACTQKEQQRAQKAQKRTQKAQQSPATPRSSNTQQHINVQDSAAAQYIAAERTRDVLLHVRAQLLARSMASFLFFSIFQRMGEKIKAQAHQLHFQVFSYVVVVSTLTRLYS